MATASQTKIPASKFASTKKSGQNHGFCYFLRSAKATSFIQILVWGGIEAGAYLPTIVYIHFVFPPPKSQKKHNCSWWSSASLKTHQLVKLRQQGEIPTPLEIPSLSWYKCLPPTSGFPPNHPIKHNCDEDVHPIFHPALGFPCLGFLIFLQNYWSNPFDSKTFWIALGWLELEQVEGRLTCWKCIKA